MGHFARNAKAILRTERLDEDPPRARPYRVPVVPSPFNVETIVRHRELFPEMERPRQLNLGLAYLKSVLYKDASIEGASLMREHLAAVAAEKTAARRRIKRDLEAAECTCMMAADAASAAFNRFEKARAAAALEKILQAEKAKYLEWAKGKPTLLRDFEAAHVPRVVRWLCLHCGTTNIRYMYACELCGEASRAQDAFVGLWEVAQLGSSGVFGVGRYRIERVNILFVLHEVPPRTWVHATLERDLHKKHAPVKCVLRGHTVVGYVQPDVPSISWSDGMQWKRIYEPKAKTEPGSLSTKPARRQPPTAARETPRAIAKQMEKIDTAATLDTICAPMRQNQSADVQRLGCLAMGRAILAGAGVDASMLQEITTRAAVAMAAHSRNTSVVYASFSLVWTLLEEVKGAATEVARVGVLVQHCVNLAASKSVRQKGKEVLERLIAQGNGDAHGAFKPPPRSFHLDVGGIFSDVVANQ
ncbi:Aste57867_1946 [Aphanomyces stellatus]|uniref:Aste57867_1946 protein n=1 Tax=Aphanomyces stellatus TaxID=120398 RepID=A0A485K7G1_9STRA|nr:hypothetical protein As57867_001944 [Aphanomyces stellatus]VFT79151.1 Aste57867_1946 [Aphanomyces stellatus]